MNEYFLYLAKPAIILLLIAIGIIFCSDFKKLKKKNKKIRFKDFLPTIGVLLTLVATIISTIDSDKTEKRIISNITGGDSTAYLEPDIEQKIENSLIKFNVIKIGKYPLYDVALIITNRDGQAIYVNETLKNLKHSTTQKEVEDIEAKISNDLLRGIKAATKSFSIRNFDITENAYSIPYEIHFPKDKNNLTFDIVISARNGIIRQNIFIEKCPIKNITTKNKFSIKTKIIKQDGKERESSVLDCE